MSDKNPLLGLRDKIDALDLQIMQAISDRAKCAQQVAEVCVLIAAGAYAI